MLLRKFYNKSVDERTDRRRLNRRALGIFLTATLSLAGCKAPKLAETDRVCDEPIGTNVTVEGVIAIPRIVNTVYVTRGGAFAEQGSQLIVSGRTGGTANVTVWTTDLPQPNRIDAVSKDAETEALRLYSNLGQVIEYGQPVRITGTVVQDPAGCAINANLIHVAK